MFKEKSVITHLQCLSLYQLAPAIINAYMCSLVYTLALKKEGDFIKQFVHLLFFSSNYCSFLSQGFFIMLTSCYLHYMYYMYKGHLHQQLIEQFISQIFFITSYIAFIVVITKEFTEINLSMCYSALKDKLIHVYK